MVRTGDYQNAEYDRRLAEYKAMKAKLQQEKQAQQGQGQIQQAKPVQTNSNSSSVVKRY